jgi:hypothetical protein
LSAEFVKKESTKWCKKSHRFMKSMAQNVYRVLISKL